MRTYTTLLSTISLLLVAPTASSQLHFSANGDAAQVRPQTIPHTEFFTATFVLTSRNTLIYESVQTVPLSQAQIFEGGPGQTSTRRKIDLVMSNGGMRGESRVLAFPEINKLKAGQYYVQAIAAGPVGLLIRGQILSSRQHFGAFLDGKHMNPATASAAWGLVKFIVNHPLSFEWELLHNVQNPTNVYLRDKTNPNFKLFLTGNQGTVQNFNWVNLLILGSLEVFIESAAFPLGEISGCGVPSASTYGAPTPHSTGTPKLTAVGAPTGRGEISLCVEGAKPNGKFGLFISDRKAALRVLNAKIHVDLGRPVAVLPIPIDSLGRGKIRITNLPELQQKAVVYVQGFGGGSNVSLDTTNGLCIVLDLCQ